MVMENLSGIEEIVRITPGRAIVLRVSGQHRAGDEIELAAGVQIFPPVGWVDCHRESRRGRCRSVGRDAFQWQTVGAGRGQPFQDSRSLVC